MVTPHGQKTASGKVDILEKSLLEELCSGKYEYASRFYSAREASERFGVTLPTAYRALNSLVKQGYLFSRNGLGIFVNRSFVPAKLKAVVVSLRLQSNPQILDFYEHLSAVAEKRGIRLLMGNGETVDNEIAFLRKISTGDADGIIRLPGDISGKESLIRQELKRLQFKCVMINDWWRPGADFPTVKSDEEAALTEILDGLYDAGHRKIALVQETLNSIRPDIQRAFWKWHWEHDLPISRFSTFYCTHDGAARMDDLRAVVKHGTTAMVFAYGLNIHDIWTPESAPLLKSLTLAALDNIPLAETELFAAYHHDNEKIAQTALDLLANYDQRSCDPVRVAGKVLWKKTVQ